MSQRGTDLLMELLDELVLAKQEVRKTLDTCPEETALHRVYAQYVDRILDVLKAWVKLRSVDRERLLLDMVSQVVRFLIEHKKTDAARFIGDHLEVIEMRVNEHWKTADSVPEVPESGRNSGNSSSPRSPASEKPRRRRKAAEKNAL